MTLPDLTRDTLLRALQGLIDGSSENPGRIEFYDKQNILLATAALATVSMIIHKGNGVFVNVVPYLRATVTLGGIADNWIIINANDIPIISGTCGDQNNRNNKDIIFNTQDLQWNENDVVVIEELSIEIPAYPKL
jgi:hypothetical protein